MADADDGPSWVLPPPFRHLGGALWAARLPEELHAETDTPAQPHRSRLRLIEDGRRVGPRHGLHQAIEDRGGGRYSFWVDMLYFSTSDGTDPNANNRSYVATLPLQEAHSAPDLSPVEAGCSDALWEPPERPLRCAFVGMGNRGLYLARMAAGYAGVEVAWVIDSAASRVDRAVAEIGGRPRGSDNFNDAIADPAVDLVFVAVPDHLHRAVAVPAFAAGKDVYLEKPVASTAADAREILAAWQRSGRILQVGYVLRHAPFYRAVRRAVRSGTLGTIRGISLSERLDVMHGASFMRRWHAQSANSGGLIVHKGCHDLDIVCWLLDARPHRISSFGGLDTFAGPPPAAFCSECDRRGDCLFVDDGLHEERSAAELRNPTLFGLDRCVFRDDKDIVDNQIVTFELSSGVRGTFELSVQNPLRTERRITLIGDSGCLEGVFEDGRFTIALIDPERDPIVWSAAGGDFGSHGGGDRRIMHDFLTACVGRAPPSVQMPDDVMPGMIFATAAEEARKSGGVITLADADFAIDGARSQHRAAAIGNAAGSSVAPAAGMNAGSNPGRRSLVALTEFRAELGFCYIVHLPSGIAGDVEQDAFQSQLRLLEDGVELGPGHTAHPEIRAAGGGRYSHWQDAIYFSASDNSDPRSNGRCYHAFVPAEAGRSPAASRAIEALRGLPADYTRQDAYAAIETAMRFLEPKVAFGDPFKWFWEDETFVRDYHRVCGSGRRAMERKYAVYQLVKSLRGVPGELAECGTYAGETAYFMALACRQTDRERPLHIFDSFEGLSQPNQFDGSFWHAGQYALSEERARANLADFADTRIYKGWIPTRFGEIADKRFCFVHVDVDLYEPTRDAVAFFYPRLEAGGMLLCDDYGSTLCPGARKAMDEFFRDKPEYVIDLPTEQGFIIKQ